MHFKGCERTRHLLQWGHITCWGSPEEGSMVNKVAQGTRDKKVPRVDANTDPPPPLGAWLDF